MLPDSQALWRAEDCRRWHNALDQYGMVVAAQGDAKLVDLDTWYRTELTAKLIGENPKALTRDDLIHVTEWKMRRGEWRARNLFLVSSNSGDEVAAAWQEAVALAPDPLSPIRRMARLAGVGPATASAALAPAFPDLYPFMDELVAAGVPGLEKFGFTVPAYSAYSAALREKAVELRERCNHAPWTAQDAGLALWSFAGGKVAASSAKNAVAGAE